MLLLFLSFLITFGVGIFHHCKRKWYIHIISDACHVCQGPINVLPICEWSTLLVPEVFYSEAFGIQISCSALIGHFVQTTRTSIATPLFITVNLILQYNPLILWSFHWAHIQTTGMPLPIIREAYIHLHIHPHWLSILEDKTEEAILHSCRWSSATGEDEPATE